MIAEVGDPAATTELVIRNGMIALSEGELLPSGEVVEDIRQIEIKGSGAVAILFTSRDSVAPGAVRDRIMMDGVTLLSTGDVLFDAQARGGRIDSIMGFDVGLDGSFFGVADRIFVSGTLTTSQGVALEFLSYVEPSTQTSSAAVWRLQLANDVLGGSSSRLSGVTDTVAASQVGPNFAPTLVASVWLLGGGAPHRGVLLGGAVVAEDGERWGTVSPDHKWRFSTAPKVAASGWGVGRVSCEVELAPNDLRGVVMEVPNEVGLMEGFPLGSTGEMTGDFSATSVEVGQLRGLMYGVPLESGGEVTAGGASTIFMRTRQMAWGGEWITGLNVGSPESVISLSESSAHWLQIVELAGGIDALVQGSAEIGMGYAACQAVPNSTGGVGSLAAIGSRQASANSLTIVGAQLPTQSMGYLLCSQAEGFVQFPGGSSGALCLGGSIGRHVDQVQSTGLHGGLATSVDLTAMPQPLGPVAVQPGDSWYFQIWHRDSFGGVATSGFSDGLFVQFQ